MSFDPIYFLVNANAVNAMADAARFGLKTARVVRTRTAFIVMEAEMCEWNAVYRWWVNGGSLVRTLGPFDVERQSVGRAG